MRLRLLLERICAQYGRCFASFVSSTASDRKGFVKGESVPLDRVLPTFARTKVGPRRVGVPALHPAKSMPRRQATTNSAQKFFCILFFTEKTPTGQALQFMPLQKSRTAPAVKDTK